MLIMIDVKEDDVIAFIEAYKKMINNPDQPSEYVNHLLPIFEKIKFAMTQNATSIRNATIWSMRKNGDTISSIGEKYGLTKERIRQICIKEKEKEDSIQKFSSKMSSKHVECSFYDCLVAAGLKLNSTVGSVTRAYRALVRSGVLNQMKSFNFDLDAYDDPYLLNIRGFGPTTLKLCREANLLYKQHLNM